MTQKHNRTKYLFPAGFDPRAACRDQRIEARRVTLDDLIANLDRSVWRGLRVLLVRARPDLPPGDRAAAIALEPGPCDLAQRVNRAVQGIDEPLRRAGRVALDMAARSRVPYVLQIGSWAGRGWTATATPDGAWSAWRAL